MAVLDPVFLDTTILLGGLIEFGAERDDAHQVLDALAEGRIPRALTAWHCCLEFFSVSTRLPEEYRLEPRDARLLLEEEILARLEVHELPAEQRRDFLREASALPVVGGRVYDFHIGSVALSAGARVLVTENGKHFDFLARHGVQVLGARDYVSLI